MTCTFFGHRFLFEDIYEDLKNAVTDLIENHGVAKFYVGNHGGFDCMSAKILKELSERYDIDYKIVLSRIPVKKDEFDVFDYSTAVVPEGIEKTPPRFRINYRNKWMVNQSDFVITYINAPYGSGAAQFAELAEKKGKTIIKLGKF